MKSKVEEDLVALYDKAPLDARYWASISLFIAVLIFDYFDFFLVGFLVAALVQQWHLTFGQSSIMLLSGGVGAIFGALIWGELADRWGRKPLTVTAVTICALSAGLISIIPDGAWIEFSLLRFMVGFGIGAAGAVLAPWTVEYTPTRHRTILSSATLIPVSFGILAAALAATTLMPVLGWRGLAAFGFLPLLPGLLIAAVVPESVRWLILHGRTLEASGIISRAMEMSPADLPQRQDAGCGVSRRPDKSSSFGDLLAMPKAFWLTVLVWFAASTANYGVFLWGPTIVALLMGLTPAEAAHLFVFVSLTGIAGRSMFAILPHWLGRRRCGEIMGYCTALTLGAAALFYDRSLLGYSAFIVILIPAALFFDGGFSNLVPHAAEIFPVRLNARGTALAQAANGFGKIAGPLCLALIAGTSNLITPKATIDALTPAFLFLAGCGLVVGLAFSFLGIETHGRPLALDEESQSNASAPALTVREEVSSKH